MLICVYLEQYLVNYNNLKIDCMKTQVLATALFFLGFISCKKDSTFTNNAGADDLHNKAVGYSANQLLSAGTYKSIKIEVQYMAGYVPDAGALAHLQNTLAPMINKPGGISIVTRESIKALVPAYFLKIRAIFIHGI